MPVGGVAPTARPPRPRWLLISMILITIGYVALFGLSVMMFIVSPLVFDSGETTRTWSAFIGFLFFPLLVLFSAILSWYGFGTRHYRLIPIGCCLPVAYCIGFWMLFS